MGPRWRGQSREGSSSQAALLPPPARTTVTRSRSLGYGCFASSQRTRPGWAGRHDPFPFVEDTLLVKASVGSGSSMGCEIAGRFGPDDPRGAARNPCDSRTLATNDEQHRDLRNAAFDVMALLGVGRRLVMAMGSRNGSR